MALANKKLHRAAPIARLGMQQRYAMLSMIEECLCFSGDRICNDLFVKIRWQTHRRKRRRRKKRSRDKTGSGQVQRAALYVLVVLQISWSSPSLISRVKTTERTTRVLSLSLSLFSVDGMARKRGRRGRPSTLQSVCASTPALIDPTSTKRQDDELFAGDVADGSWVQ
jgi:hypothetical protein